MKYMQQKENEVCQADYFNQAHKIDTPLILNLLKSRLEFNVYKKMS